MADATLAIQSPPSDGNKIPIRDHTSDLLQSAYELKQAADQRADRWRQALIEVAKRLCADKSDQLRRVTEATDAKTLAEMIISEVADRLDELEWYKAKANGSQAGAAPTQPADGQDEARLRRLQQENETLRQETGDLKAANHNFEAQVQQLMATNAQLQSELDSFRSAQAALTDVAVEPELQAPAVNRELWPDWLKEMEATRGFNNALRFVKVVGSTWECRRHRLAQMLMKPGTDSGHLRTLPKIMAESKRPLITLLGAAGDDDDDGDNRPASHADVAASYKHGRPGNLVSLTDTGREAYQLIFGTPPLRAYEQYLARHKSDPQITLVLEAIDLLEWAGYTVDRFPPVVNLPGDHRFAPDLIARQDGRENAIEVEVGSAYYNTGDRDQKWRNVAAATGRQIYVIAPNRDVMQAIQTELMSWQVGKDEVRVYLTNISETKALQRQGKLTADGIWLRKR